MPKNLKNLTLKQLLQEDRKRLTIIKKLQKERDKIEKEYDRKLDDKNPVNGADCL